MALLLLLALLAAPSAADAQASGSAAGPPIVGLAAVGESPDLVGKVPDSTALRSVVVALFNRSDGRLVRLAADQTGASAAGIQITAAGGVVQTVTTLGAGASTRSLSSTVPFDAPGALVSTITSDLAYLWFSLRSFTTLPLSPPPVLTAELQTDTLQALTQWNLEDLEPLSVAGSAQEVTLCFPHRYLTLGPRFQVTLDTVRDINAQAGADEPEQLSAALPDGDGGFLLLSQRDARIAAVDPLLGARAAWTAPQLAGLPGASRAGTQVVMPGLGEGTGGLWVYSLDPSAPETQPSRIDGTGSTYYSALARDAEGNLWAWDSQERRIRIVDSLGRQVYCIRPLFSPAIMELPQQLAVLSDGTFLLGGSGEVWGFSSAGVPAWRLARIPGRLPERLPASFVLAADRADQTFTLLDGPSHRLLQFALDPGQASPFSSLLAHLDRGNPNQLSQALSLARSEGDTLMALELAGDLARRGGPDLTDAVGADLLNEKVRRYADLAELLIARLLYDRAEPALLRAGDAARELTAQRPDDEAAARLLDTLLGRRQEVRDALTTVSQLRVMTAQAQVTGAHRAGLYAGTLDLSLAVANTGTAAATQVRIHLGLPGEDPVLGQLDSLQGGQTAAIQIHMAGPLSRRTLRAARASNGVPAALLVTYVVGQEGTSAAVRQAITILPDPSGPRPVDSLIGQVDPG